MPNVFFTSDEHIGHNNIIKFCNRPFANTWEMRDTLIKNHNDKVEKGDLVYHLGDMFWRTLSQTEMLDYICALNGNHYYIWGNHEEAFQGNEFLKTKFVWLKDCAEIRPRAQYPKIWLSHYAHRVWPGSHRGSWHAYGHSHAELPEKGLSIDVGVDQHGFSPISIDEYAAIMQTKIEAGVTHELHEQIEKNKW